MLKMFRFLLILGVLSFLPNLTIGQVFDSRCQNNIVIPDGIYLTTQPYEFQLDTQCVYMVIFNDRIIKLTEDNSFLINSMQYFGDLRIFNINNNDTMLILDKKMRFKNPTFNVRCFGNKYSGSAINRSELWGSYIGVEILNYSLGLTFPAKSVKLKVINYLGGVYVYEFNGFKIPGRAIARISRMESGLLILDVISEINYRDTKLDPVIYYYVGDSP